jgi:hypothetical protein
VDARLDQVERRMRNGDRPAGRRIHARDLTVGPEARPAGLVALDRLRDRRGQAGVDAAGVMDAPRGARGAPFPRGGRLDVRRRLHQLVCVVGGAGAGAATGADDVGAAALANEGTDGS